MWKTTRLFLNIYEGNRFTFGVIDNDGNRLAFALCRTIGLKALSDEIRNVIITSIMVAKIVFGKISEKRNLKENFK